MILEKQRWKRITNFFMEDFMRIVEFCQNIDLEINPLLILQ